MAATFSTKSIQAKPTFGGYNQSLYAGEYTTNKKIRSIFCSPNICNSSRPLGSQTNLYYLRRSNYLTFNTGRNYDNTDIYSGLFTAIDLSGVNVIQNNITPPFVSPTPISATAVPYTQYCIDPSGLLFGNSTCGYFNYENFIVSNNTTNPIPPNN